jgi:beta-glucosidase
MHNFNIDNEWIMHARKRKYALKRQPFHCTPLHCLAFDLKRDEIALTTMNQRTQTIDSFIEKTLKKLSLEEKVSLCYSGSKFGVNPVPRLKIPVLEMSDGPHGVRHEISKTSWEPAGSDDDYCTYLPTGTAQAATWNRERMRDCGRVLGAEARHRGKDVILGPGINIIRTPLCGRNFEYYSEDPYLIAELAVPAIQAIQEQGVAACAKHFAVNNQELNRYETDVAVDERTLHELYLPGFHAAIKRAEVLTVMGAYNKFRGQYCCHNDYLVNQLLKEKWGFKGAYISDWAGVHSTDEAARCGTDIEMGTPKPFNEFYLAHPYLEGLRVGKYSIQDLDDKVRRTLRVLRHVGAFDSNRQPGARNTANHQAAALAAAREGIVLLKNENATLPLDPTCIRKLAIIGENAELKHASGGNSSGVKSLYEISPLEGIRRRLGESIEVVFAKGYPDNSTGLEAIPTQYLFTADAGSGVRGWRAFYQKGRAFEGETLEIYAENAAYNKLHDDLPTGYMEDNFCVSWQTELNPPESGCYTFGFLTDGYVELAINGETRLTTEGDAQRFVETVEIQLKKNQPVTLTLRYRMSNNATYVRFGWRCPGADPSGASLRDEALKVAAEADAVIFVGGLTHMDDIEGRDRKDLRLPGEQDSLIEALLTINPNTILTFVGGSPIEMPWIEQAKAVLWLWYAGMEGGSATAEILFGQVNPSGKLPFTFPKKLAEVPAHNNMGTYCEEISDYQEGLMVGYRYYVTHGRKPLFAFGHGLSYTSFEYANLSVMCEKQPDEIRVEIDIVNSGNRFGQEVAQLYVEDLACSVPRPRMELKGFEKVALEPGASRRVSFKITTRDLSFYDIKTGNWIFEDGEFTFHVGSASDAITQSITYNWSKQR